MKKFLFTFMATIFIVIQGYSQTLLNESFEGAAFPPLNWITQNTRGPATLWENTTDFAHTGSVCAFVSYNADGTTNYLITPKLSINTTNHQISFWAKMDVFDSDYNQTYLRVLVSNNTNDFTSFDTIPLLALSPSYSGINQLTDIWQQWTIDLSAYNGQNIYVAFKHDDDDGYGLCIDDISGPELFVPSCLIPTDLTISNILTTDAQLGWTDTVGLLWNIQYMPDSEIDWSNATNITNITTNHFTITGLNPATAYKVRVRTDCLTEQSEWSIPISFFTLCPPISQFPWTEGFESEWIFAIAPGNKPSPNCWTIVDKGIALNTWGWVGDYFWSKSEDNNHTGSSSAQCYTYYGVGVGHNDWLITPQISLTGNERLRFWAMRNLSTTEESEEISIFISNEDITLDTVGMGQYGNIPNFTQIFTQILPIGNWQEFEINLSQYNGNRYIAFVRQNSPSGSVLRLDDVEISTLPTCPRPTNVVASNITTTDAEISWVNGSSTDASWWLYYKQSTSTTFDSLLINTNPYTLTNLLPSSGYDIYVVTDCSTELSEASPIVNFRTLCDEISTLPWSDNFDTYGTTSVSYPQCWTRPVINNYYGTDYPSIYNNDLTSSASIIFQTVTTTPTYAVTPAFDSNINTLMVSFWLKTEGLANPGTITVGVMDNTSDITTFEEVQTITSILTDWTRYEIILNGVQLQGGNKSIAFRHNSYSDDSYILLDDIEVDLIPACPNVYGLIVEAESTTSVSISWTDNGYNNLGYNIAYSSNLTGEFDPNTATVVPITTVSNLPYILSGFNPGDSVWVAVQRGCNGVWTNAIKVNLPEFVNPLPFVANFESSALDNIWTITNGTQTNKWYIGAAGANDSDPSDEIDERGLYISNDLGATASYDNLNRSVTFVSTLVEFDNSPAFELSFDWLNVGYFSNYGSVFYPHDYIDVYLLPLNVILIPGILPDSQYKINHQGLCNSASFQALIQPLNFDYSNSVMQLVFAWKNAGGGGNTNSSAKIDNVSLIGQSCGIPSNLVMDSAGYDGTIVYLSWTEPQGATAGIIEFQEIGTTTWDQVVATSNPFPLTGLIPGKNYQARVCSICTSNDTSSMSSITTFQTTCGTISSFPWSEGFESTNWTPAVAPGNKPAPNCWTVVNKGDSGNDYFWKHSSSGYYGNGSHSGNGHAMCYTNYGTTNHNDWLITPQITLTGNERLRFWAMRASSVTDEPDEISVYISDENVLLDTTSMGEYGNMPNFSQIFNQMLPVGSWQEYEVNLNQYSGNRYIAFVRQNTPDGYYLRLDDVLIDSIPSCAKPTNVISVNSNQNDIEIGWTNGNLSDASWYVYFRHSGTTNYDSVLANSNPYILSGLTSATTYDIYVRTNCGYELSEASPVINLATDCEIITSFPWSEGFESSTWAPAISPGNKPSPNCWTVIDKGDFIGANYWKYTSSSFTEPSHSGNGHAMCYAGYGTTNHNDWLITPQIALTGNERLRFWAMRSNQWILDTNEISVFISDQDAIIDTTGMGISGNVLNFSQVFNQILPLGDWQEYEINLSQYYGNRYIAFVRKNSSDGSNHLRLDDVLIETMPTCVKPTNLVLVNNSINSITIGWSNGNTIDNSWYIYYKPIDSINYDSILAYSNPFTLTNLIESTIYDVYVKTDCGTEFSEPSIVNTFQTACNILNAPTLVERFDASATPSLCWELKTGLLQSTGSTILTPVHNNWTSWTYDTDSIQVGMSGYVKDNIYGTDVNSWLISPSIELGNNGINYQVELDVLLTGFSNNNIPDFNGYDDKFGIVISTDNGITWTATNAFLWTNEVGSIRIFNDLYPMNHIIIPLINPENQLPYQGIVKIGIYGESTVSNANNYLNFDNFQVSIVIDTCIHPTNILISNISNSSANVTWVAGADETAWQVTTDTTGLTIDVNNTPSYQLTSLASGTNYTVYVRANCGGTYSTWQSQIFTTLPTVVTPPIVTTLITNPISQYTATLNGTVTAGSETIITQGFEWKEASATTWVSVPATLISGAITHNLTSLIANTSYEFRAFATTATNTYYGSTENFTTLPIVAPTVVTNPATPTSGREATLNGIVTAGTESISAQGFEWKATSETTWNNVTATLIGNAITHSLTDLTPNTAYEFKAYAITESGTINGAIESFTTLGLEDAEENSISLTIYPNPATNETRLIVIGVSGQTKIVLSDVQGRILNTIDTKAVNGVVEQTIDVNNLAKGVYYVRIQNSNLNRTNKLIVK